MTTITDSTFIISTDKNTEVNTVLTNYYTPNSDTKSLMFKSVCASLHLLIVEVSNKGNLYAYTQEPIEVEAYQSPTFMQSPQKVRIKINFEVFIEPVDSFTERKIFRFSEYIKQIGEPVIIEDGEPETEAKPNHLSVVH